MTTEITDDQIEQLRDESAAHGDILMAAIANRALGPGAETDAGYDLSNQDHMRLNTRSVESCRSECERVIRNAQAQR